MTEGERVVYNACQVYIAGVSIGVGVVLALPGTTFSLSPAYEVLRQIPITEEMWGLVYTCLGIACFISAYFSRLLALRQGDADFGHWLITAVYRLLRLTWFVSSPLWFFWAGCYLAATPISIGTVFFIATGLMSIWVYTRVTKEARQYG